MDSHLDAERLAAFMEGSISRRERAEIERHAADCVVCMQQLAALARTTEVPAARTAALPRFMRWAVPAAVAATAVAVWINVNDPRAPAIPADAMPAAPQVQQKDPPLREFARDAQAPAPASPAPAEAKQAPFEASRRMQRADSEERAKVAEAPVSVPEQPAAIAGAAAALQDMPASAAPAPPPTVAQPVASPRPLAETVQMGRGESLARSAAADLGVQFELRSPDAARRWRVRGRVLERSLDAGRTWQAQGPALAMDVLAGSAPSPDVAWLVGRAGAVLRTTDGHQWARVSFPDAADLTAVQAVSAVEAAITTADGRRFRTTDGGVTWTLQETPARPF